MNLGCREIWAGVSRAWVLTENMLWTKSLGEGLDSAKRGPRTDPRGIPALRGISQAGLRAELQSAVRTGSREEGGASGLWGVLNVQT